MNGTGKRRGLGFLWAFLGFLGALGGGAAVSWAVLSAAADSNDDYAGLEVFFLGPLGYIAGGLLTIAVGALVSRGAGDSRSRGGYAFLGTILPFGLLAMFLVVGNFANEIRLDLGDRTDESAAAAEQIRSLLAPGLDWNIDGGNPNALLRGCDSQVSRHASDIQISASTVGLTLQQVADQLERDGWVVSRSTESAWWFASRRGDTLHLVRAKALFDSGEFDVETFVGDCVFGLDLSSQSSAAQTPGWSADEIDEAFSISGRVDVAVDLIEFPAGGSLSGFHNSWQGCPSGTASSLEHETIPVDLTTSELLQWQADAEERLLSDGWTTRLTQLPKQFNDGTMSDTSLLLATKDDVAVILEVPLDQESASFGREVVYGSCVVDNAASFRLLLPDYNFLAQ